MALEKIYSTEHFYNTKADGLGEIFVQQKFSAIWYMRVHRVYAHTFEGEGLNNIGNHSSFDRHPIMN